MAPSHATLLALTMHSLLYPPSSPNPWPTISPSCSPMSQVSSWNFSQNTIPEVLKDAPQCFFDNPIALQKRYFKLKDARDKKKVRVEMCKDVKVGAESFEDASLSL